MCIRDRHTCVIFRGSEADDLYFVVQGKVPSTAGGIFKLKAECLSFITIGIPVIASTISYPGACLANTSSSILFCRNALSTSSIVVAVLALTHRYNVVRGHRTGSL